jgi:hypothetical protein
VDLHCNDSLYTPVAEDVGCKLAVRCVPVATAAPVGADVSKSSTALMRGDACECVSGVNSNSSNVHVLVMCVHGLCCDSAVVGSCSVGQQKKAQESLEH